MNSHELHVLFVNGTLNPIIVQIFYVGLEFVY